MRLFQYPRLGHEALDMPDGEHVLEPVDVESCGRQTYGKPLVRDLRGRLWSVERRPSGSAGALWQRFKAFVSA